MPLGILEPAHAGHVPGTVNVWQEAQRDAELLESARHLKKTKDGRKILVPQPTDDPNDPLVIAILSIPLGAITYEIRIGHYGNET